MLSLIAKFSYYFDTFFCFFYHICNYRVIYFIIQLRQFFMRVIFIYTTFSFILIWNNIFISKPINFYLLGDIYNFYELIIRINTVKAFVVTPKMTKNSIILRGGVTTKAIKIFYSRWIFIICILIYFNKNIYFHWIFKNIRVIK